MARRMTRDPTEDIIYSILSGGLQGFGQAAQQAGGMERELYKTVMAEDFKRKMFPEESELKKAQAEYYRSRGKSALGELTSIPEGYEVGYDKSGRQILKSTKKPSETETFRENLRQAKQAIRTGESTVDEEVSNLQDIYPEKDFTIHKLQWKSLIPKAQKTQPEGKPLFQNIKEGMQGLFRTPQTAPITAINPKTKERIIWKDGKWQPY